MHHVILLTALFLQCVIWATAGISNPAPAHGAGASAVLHRQRVLVRGDISQIGCFVLRIRARTMEVDFGGCESAATSRYFR